MGPTTDRLFRPSQSHTKYTLTNLISKCKLKINIEEIGPVIVYTKELILKLWQIHISQFNFTPAPPISKWRAAKLKDIHKLLVWWKYVTHKSNKQHLESMNYVFANRSMKDEETYPLTIQEIVEQ